MEDDEYVEFDLKKLLAFEGSTHIPQGFTTVTLPLDLSPSSTLSWQSVLQTAELLSKQGYSLLFDLDFGFHRDSFPGFLHESYFSACRFAINRFAEDILPLVPTIGVILAKFALPYTPLWRAEYLPFSDGLDKEHFLRDLLADYLERLAHAIPPSHLRIICLDSSSLQDPLAFSLATQSDRFHAFTLAIKNSPYYTSTITWQTGTGNTGYIGNTMPHPSPSPKLALLLPSDKTALPALQEAFSAIKLRNVPYRAIPELELTHAWDGIDELFLPSISYSKTTIRALDGFKAAGGILTVL